MLLLIQHNTIKEASSLTLQLTSSLLLPSPFFPFFPPYPPLAQTPTMSSNTTLTTTSPTPSEHSNTSFPADINPVSAIIVISLLFCIGIISFIGCIIFLHRYKKLGEDIITAVEMQNRQTGIERRISVRVEREEGELQGHAVMASSWARLAGLPM